MLLRPLLGALALFTVVTPGAQAQINWTLVAAEDPYFAQMVGVLAPEYGFQYTFTRTRTFGNLYLLSGIPVASNVAPNASDPTYFDVERPAAGLITSFHYSQLNEPVPVERVLVRARRVSADILSFSCELFAAGAPRRTVCRGSFHIGSGAFDMDFIDLLLDTTEDDLRRRPDAECVRELYPTDRGNQECEFLDRVNNLRCSIASYLFARHQCRAV